MILTTYLSKCIDLILEISRLKLSLLVWKILVLKGAADKLPS